MGQVDFLKYAYSLGLDRAVNEAGLEKVALGGILAKMLGRGAVATAAKGGAQAAAKKPGVLGHLGSLFGFGGKGTLGQTLSAPLRPILGREGAHQALGFGTFGGAVGAATAEEGDRMGAFGRGFGLGTIGGAGWHWGQKGTQALMRGVAGTGKGGGLRGALSRVTTAPAKGATGAAAQDLTGLGKIYSSGLGPKETAKLMGARSLYGVGGLGAGMAASGFLEGKAEEHIPALRQSMALGTRQWMKAPFAAAQMSRRRLGLTPGRTTGYSPGSYSGTSSGAYR